MEYQIRVYDQSILSKDNPPAYTVVSAQNVKDAIVHFGVRAREYAFKVPNRNTTAIFTEMIFRVAWNPAELDGYSNLISE